MVANSFRLRGQLDLATACVQGLTRFFETQLSRFCESIEDPTHQVKENPQRRPHMRFLAESFAENPEKQVRYINRSLAQITATRQCPELYFRKNGAYVPNGHTPLAWTQANQALALHFMEQSIGD